jgi:protein-S-isoprenylcysteine O-methyltransferase Ste14
VHRNKTGRVSIRRWHWGKIAILWAWGGTVVALLLTNFLSSPANQTPILSTVTFLGSLAILIALSAFTWIWLGGKEVNR